MRKVQEYRQHAAACRELARTTAPEQRETLLKMAAAWDALAEGRQRRFGNGNGNGNGGPLPAA